MVGCSTERPPTFTGTGDGVRGRKRDYSRNPLSIGELLTTTRQQAVRLPQLGMASDDVVRQCIADGVTMVTVKVNTAQAVKNLQSAGIGDANLDIIADALGREDETDAQPVVYGRMSVIRFAVRRSYLLANDANVSESGKTAELTYRAVDCVLRSTAEKGGKMGAGMQSLIAAIGSPEGQHLADALMTEHADEFAPRFAVALATRADEIRRSRVADQSAVGPLLAVATDVAAAIPGDLAREQAVAAVERYAAAA